MSKRYRGGFITANPPVPAGPYQNGAASGAWSLQSQMQYIQQGLWPIAGNLPPPFIGMLGGTGAQFGNGVAVDTNGNMFFAGDGNSGTVLAKYSITGAIQWQKKLGSSSSNVWNATTVDSSGNVYACGTSNPSGTTDFQVAKYDTSGTVLWQRYLNYFSVGADTARGIVTDSSGNVYVCGDFYEDGNAVYYGLVVKYNSAGTLQFQTSPANAGFNVNLYGIALDSSGNIYVCGGTGAGQSVLIKLNSSGVQQWAKGGYDSSSFRGVTVDASGNIYVTGGGSGAISIAKFDTSGTNLWYRKYTSPYGGALGLGITLDASNNVYACGYAEYSGTNNDAHIIKVDSSGTLQWQRVMRAPGVQPDYANSITMFGSRFIFNGYTLNVGSGDILFANLPTDGTKTGTYTVNGVSITYAAASLTASTVTPSISSISVSSSSASVPEAASTLTAANTTLTSSVTTI